MPKQDCSGSLYHVHGCAGAQAGPPSRDILRTAPVPRVFGVLGWEWSTAGHLPAAQALQTSPFMDPTPS